MEIYIRHLPIFKIFTFRLWNWDVCIVFFFVWNPWEVKNCGALLPNWHRILRPKRGSKNLKHHLQQPLGYWKVLSHPKKYILNYYIVLIHGMTWEVNERRKRVETLWWSLTWWRYDRPDLHQKFNQMLEVKDAPEIITCKFTHIESLTLPTFQKLFNHKSAHSPQPMTVMTRFWWPFAILVWVFHGILLAWQRVRAFDTVALSSSFGLVFQHKPPRPSVCEKS